MGNREIAAQFNLLAALMELHGENPFKTKTYLSAYQSLRKWDKPLADMVDEEIAAIPGVGASNARKIRELITTGTLDQLEKLKEKTPAGIQQLLTIKGMGPKKIRTIWDTLGIETPAELLHACNENRLVKLPGFGLKTQEDLCVKISYFLDSTNRYLYGVIESDLSRFEEQWKKTFPSYQLEWAGEYARKMPVVSSIECIISPSFDIRELDALHDVAMIEQSGNQDFSISYMERYTIRCIVVPEDRKLSEWSRMTMGEYLYAKLSRPLEKYKGQHIDEFLRDNGYANLPAELFDFEKIEQASSPWWDELVRDEDIKGIVHSHSTFSDGIHSLEEMAKRVKESGYAYFGICDHSQSAFYANGLSPERLADQWAEIEKLNQKMAPFVILKGIESDILNDGSLDYDEDILKQFDLVIVSVHSLLRMDEDRATQRLIRAIENPYTHILGHPTSRLLLARPGYPILYKKVIDACAANGVAIELNANPQRMEIDYHWIPYCEEKGVWISINPDAHSRSQLGYMKYGVITARKGGLKKQHCINALPVEGFLEEINRKAR